MSRWFVSALLLLLSACALRPRYSEVLSRFSQDGEPQSEVVIQVLDRNDVPVPGARIEVGDRNRFRATTDADGVFRLPIEKRFVDENPLVVVVLPQGVKGYKLVQPARDPETIRSEPLTAPEPEPAETVDDADAGVTTM